MNLFKKIFILVNLILCMICSTVFAEMLYPYSYIYSDVEYEITYDYIEECPYFVVYRHRSMTTSSYPWTYYFYFSNQPMYFGNHSSYSEDSILLTYDESIDFKCYAMRVNINSTNLITGNITENLSSYKNRLPDSLKILKDDYTINESKFTMLYSNYDVINSFTGDVVLEATHSKVDDPTIPDFDDSTIDWESAFDFYVGSLDLENIEGKAYEYSGHNYSDKLYLFWALHSLDDTISVSATEELGFHYFLESNLEFIFTDSDGNKHSEVIPTTHLFNDSIFAFELPYLVRNDSLGKTEEYSPFIMALEFYLGPFTGNYENWEAWFYECVECYVDSYGYFDYEIILHSKVYKVYDYDISTKIEVYTYADIPITYDMNSSSYVAGKDGPSIFYPDKENKDVYYILGPNKEIVGYVDNTDDYDINEDNYLVDSDGNVIGRPEFDDTTGDWNFVNSDGDVITNIYNINDIPTPEEIINNIEVIGDYDLSRIFNGLKYELEELLEGNSLFNKFSNMFQQIINWLPFSIKSLFFILISFYLIFEFIHILRK